MYSECPFCNRTIKGSSINKRETSLLRSTYKFFSSLLVPIPFVGGYIGGKIYDLCSSPEGWYYRFLCPHCRCSWIATSQNSNIKIGGNKHLIIFFYSASFVYGVIEDGFYTIHINEDSLEKTTIVSKDENGIVTHEYLKDKSVYTNEITYGKLSLTDGLYVGEYLDNKPNGWGIIFHKNGYIWYGRWDHGRKHGIGYECDFNGNNYKAGYWRLDKFII